MRPTESGLRKATIKGEPRMKRMQHMGHMAGRSGDLQSAANFFSR